MSAGSWVVSLVVGVLPAAALMWLFRWLDRHRPAPRDVLYVTMALGAAVCLPAALLEMALHRILGDATIAAGRLLDAFVVTALTEESLKLLVVLGWPVRRNALADVMDGVIYTVAASLGLGVLENLAYSAADLPTAIARGLTAVPIHAAASGIMGYFVGRALFARPQSRVSLYLSGLALAVLAHGFYDWAVFNRGPWWFLESLAVLFLASALLTSLVRHAIAHDDAALGRPSLPTNNTLQSWPADVTTTLSPGKLESPTFGSPDRE